MFSGPFLWHSSGFRLYTVEMVPSQQEMMAYVGKCCPLLAIA